MNKPAIIIEHLTKKYEDVKAVDNLSLRVEKGELFGLLGPNGAGKTTTINILCGLTKPTEGTAKVGDYDVQKEGGKVKDMIGVCPQETAVYPYLTGAENVELFGNLQSMDKETLKKRRAVLLEKMGLYKTLRERLRNTAAA
jgi:ABC-2 type transport system ATP-binding protein